MTPERWALVQERLHEVLEAAPEQQEALLARLASADPDLASEVRSLVEAEARGSLGRGLDGPRPDLVGEAIGPYRLVRRLGQGGMGTVYLAEREQGGFSQRVALKLLRGGLADPRLAALAAHERRVLARLEHPGISRLIDGGSTPSGQPFLVMEYVEGRTLQEDAAERRLPLADRLRLVVEVCDAVHYAHQQLVVHRDLKPSNIMVGPEGRPRLLDFGVAKLIDPGDVSGGATGSTHWVTPAYASPEQIRREPVSTLSDVYALGVILYELLSGQRPYALDGLSPGEMERVVTETVPPPPSMRCDDEAGRRALSGDLDTIVLKAMAAVPARRYQSAEQLADDLRRYLAGHPVLARPDSLGYRVGKFVRRHRAAVSAAAAAAATLVAAVVLVARQARIARAERDRARAAGEQAMQVTDYVIGLFEAAGAGQPSTDTTVERALLRLGVARAEELSGQPLVQARMFDALGLVFHRLNRFDQAADLIGRAARLRQEQLPAEHPDVAESHAHLGAVLRAQSRFPEALPHLERALAIRRRVFGPRSVEVAESYRDLGFLLPYLTRDEESVRYYRAALAIDREVLGADHPQTADDLRLVGTALRRVGREAEGVGLLEEALAILTRALGADDPATAQMRFSLADQLRLVGRQAEAEALYREGIAARRRTMTPGDPGLVHGLGNLADLLGQQGRGAEAESLLREVMALQLARHGPQSFDHASAVGALANELTRQGRYVEALDLRRRALAVWRAELGTDHVAVAGALGHESELLQHLGRLAEAERTAREALAIRLRLLGPNQALTGISRQRLAEVLLAQGRLAAAESAAVEGLATISATRSATHPDRRRAHAVLARVLAAQGRGTEADRHRQLAEGR